jgi:cation transport regulator ChaC
MSKFDKLTEAYLKVVNENIESNDINSELAVSESDWGDSYHEVKNLISQLLSYGMDKSILAGVLRYAEEVGYTGESVDNLIKLIQHFNQKGVQDS